MTEVMVIQGRELHAEEIGLIRSLLANLGFLTNNTRFPVLPRVTVPHLAGHLLATLARRVRATLQHLVAAVARRQEPR